MSRSNSEMSGTPSVLPVANFHANQDAACLRKTLKRFICHSRELFDIICCRCNWQRQEIARTFKLMYGKNLIKKLKTRLSGAADDQKQRLLLALMEPAAVYDAKQLRKAMQGFRRKSVLIEVMTSRTNKQITAIRRAYEETYMTELESDLSRKTSGYLQRLLVSLCACRRDESNSTDRIKAAKDALKLYSARQHRFGLENCFIEVLVNENFAQLQLVFNEYEKEWYRYESDLVRLIVSRSECDMGDIRAQYQVLYKKSVSEAIRKHFSGSYKRGLIAIVDGNGT